MAFLQVSFQSLAFRRNNVHTRVVTERKVVVFMFCHQGMFLFIHWQQYIALSDTIIIIIENCDLISIIISWLVYSTYTASLPWERNVAYILNFALILTCNFITYKLEFFHVPIHDLIWRRFYFKSESFTAIYIWYMNVMAFWRANPNIGLLRWFGLQWQTVQVLLEEWVCVCVCGL